MKTYVVGTHKKCLRELLLMSIHNMCYHGELGKLLTSYSASSGLKVLIIPWTRMLITYIGHEIPDKPVYYQFHYLLTELLIIQKQMDEL